MTLPGSETLNQIRSGQLTLGFGAQNLRGSGGAAACEGGRLRLAVHRCGAWFYLKLS
jgi:hypothetical protein